MKCAYPPCPVEIASGGDNSPLFCEKHLAVKCVMSHCVLTTIPNSGYCQEHNDWVNNFDFIHGVRHAEAARRQAEAERNQAIVNQVMGKGNGNQGGLVIKGH